MATTDIAKLVVSLEAESAKMRSELEKANKKLDRFGKRANTVTSRVSKAFKSMGGVLIGGALTIGLKNLVDNTLDAADAMAKTADAIGVSTDLLQELNFAAERSGVSTAQLSSNMTAFVKRVGEAKSATGPLVSFLKKYDQALLDNIVNAKDQEEALKLVADAIQAAATPTEKAAIANAAFSRSGIGMVNMLRDGRDGLDAFREAAQEAGVVLEEDLLRQAERLNDEWDTFATKLKVDVQTAILETAGFIDFLADEIQALFEGVKEDDIVRLEDQITKIQRIMEGGLFEAGERVRFFGKDGIVEYYDDEELQAELNKLIAARDKAIAELNQPKGVLKTPPIEIPDIDTDPAEAKLTSAERAAQRAAEQMEAFALSLTHTHNPAARLEAELQKIEEAMEAGHLTAEVYGDAVAAAHARAADSLKITVDAQKISNDEMEANKKKAEEVNDVARDLGLTFSSAFEDAVVSGSGLQDILKGIEEDLLRIFTRKLITEPLADMFTSALGGAGGGGAGGGIGGFLSGLIPSFDGGGFTGIGGRSGGLDGRGGFLAMMHPQETVIDHNRQQQAGGVTVVQNITTPDADSFRMSGRQTARDARLAYGGF